MLTFRAGQLRPPTATAMPSGPGSAARPMSTVISPGVPSAASAATRTVRSPARVATGSSPGSASPASIR